MSLLVDFCSYKAAKWAVEHWHYSQSMPAGKIVKCGVWESDKFIGCVLFSRGANPYLGSSYGLLQTEVCELTRVALSTHTAPVSQIVMKAIKLLKIFTPPMRLIVSFADPLQNHYGGIYQAMNWLYVGMNDNSGNMYIRLNVNGKSIEMHKRSVFSKWGSVANIPYKWEYTEVRNKHKYLFPLDKAMRRQIEPLAQPYPKRAGD